MHPQHVRNLSDFSRFSILGSVAFHTFEQGNMICCDSRVVRAFAIFEFTVRIEMSPLSPYPDIDTLNSLC